MEEKKEMKSKIMTTITILIVLMLISIILSAIASLFMGDSGDSGHGNVAVIGIKGTIASESAGFFDKGSANSDDIIRLIKKADNNPEIKAIILEINSPGGSAVASDEIGNAIKKTNKTTVAVIRDVGASGGYWVASASDYIISNRMSLTGSIGVTASYLEFSGLLERYNITYERLVAGKYKDIGSPLKEITPEERNLLQQDLDEIHEEFIKEIAVNRNMSEEKVREIATGMFYTGRRAKDLGLVDELGGLDEAKAYIEKNLNITAEVVEYEKPMRLSDIFSQIMSKGSFSVGEGIGSAFVSETKNSNGLSMLS